MVLADTGNSAVFSYYGRLAKVQKYVEEQYGKHISLEDAAAVAGLEPKYFSAYFRKKTGMCFRDWLADYRVRKAMLRMRTQNASITEIAYSSGFRDLRTLERAFRAHLGVTPSEYKKAVMPVVVPALDS